MKFVLIIDTSDHSNEPQSVIYEQNANVYKRLLILFKINACLKMTNAFKFQTIDSLVETIRGYSTHSD